MKVEVAAMMCGMGWWVVGMADNKVSKWGKKKCNELVQEKKMIRVIIVTISTVTREMRKTDKRVHACVPASSTER